MVLSTADERNDVGRRKGKKKKRKVEGCGRDPRNTFNFPRVLAWVARRESGAEARTFGLITVKVTQHGSCYRKFSRYGK